MIDSFNTVTELPANDVRVVRSTFDIKLNGYIIPNTLQNTVSSLKKFRNKSKIIFSMETVDNPALLLPNVPIQDLGTSEKVFPETYNNENDPRAQQLADSLLNTDPSNTRLEPGNTNFNE
jgi:hypothetical protein